MPVRLDTPVQYVKGVGPRRAEVLEEAGIRTVEDLLKYRPFRYEDRTAFRRIADLRPDGPAVVCGRVAAASQTTTSRKRMKIFEILLEDGTGVLPVKFFNQTYLERVLKKGRTVVLFGTARPDDFTAPLSMINPEFEILDSTESRSIHTGRIVPVYRRIGPLTTRVLRQILHQLLQDLEPSPPDPIPERLRAGFGFPDRRRAFQELHFPTLPDGDRRAFLESLEIGRSAVFQRFVFEEFFLFQIGLAALRLHRREAPKRWRIRTDPRIREAVKAILPFRPTAAQKRVLGEIVTDLTGNRVMNRLLQGDVGSGKTLVALQAMVVVIENGLQAVLMVPTEILAEQHFRNLLRYLKGARYRLALLTGSLRAAAKRETLKAAAEGTVDLVVGTHALIEKDVEFRRLGLVVIDEQHRFGVLQRHRLMEKGERPDTLVMTATPIPRSLAMTLYGDLDLSVIDELPLGRRPVRTLLRRESERPSVYRQVRRELSKGRQAYIVYPLVEESEKLQLRAAVRMAEMLQKEVFPEFRVGLLHGKMKGPDKDALMRDFLEARIQVLVATTVIEVGIDVSNATIMVIEHADRFGLSQLHQLRGRVGRGPHESLCVLLSGEGGGGSQARERLDIMRRTSDGFRIAEKDLELRGPGEFVGTRQSGMPEFRFGNILRDRKWLELARREAVKLTEGIVDPRRRAAVIEDWRQRYGLYEVG